MVNNSKKKIVIIGATSAIAEHCARLWSVLPVELFLVGRNMQRLDVIAADIRVRSPLSVVVSVQADFVDPIKISQLADELASGNPIDIVLIAHGYLPDQDAAQKNLDLCSEALLLNGLSPVIFAEAFVKQLDAKSYGTLAIIGSVAGDRGRKSNYIYGSAKGLVTRYAQGLQHRFAQTAIKIVLIKPGPTDTPMTQGLKAQGASLASVEQVAVDIVKGIEKGKTVIYTPVKWLLIMMIIRHLPNFIFNKMNI